MKNIILEAYKDVENIQTFTEDAFLTYTKERLKLQEPVVKFIEKIKQEKFDVLDIGSGSSVLSYALHEAGLLKSADCIEPSKSRYEFAQKWKADNYKNSNVNNYNLDIQKYNTQDNYDVITIIDNTLSYISIFYAENEIYDIFKNIFEVLKDTGVLIIEALAQTGGILVYEKGHHNKIALLMNITNAKFRRPIRPGDVIDLYAKGLHISNTGGKIKAKASVDNILCVEAQLSFVLIDKNQL